MKYSPLRILIVCGFALVFHSPQNAFAGSSDKPVKAIKSEADLEWEQLSRAPVFGKSLGLPALNSGKSPEQQREEQKNGLISLADRFRDFIARNPYHESVPQARQRETLALIGAALRGDNTQSRRRDSLLEQVRKDADLHPSRRYEAVAWSKQITIAARKPSKRSDLLLENERVAREMILEFPSVSDGYESLFSIARDSDPERSKVILVDLEKMTTPPWLKDRARMHLTRLALLRRSLPSVLSSADEVALISPTRGLPVAIYSWSVGSPVNQAKIRALAAKNKHVFFLGVCLDPDSPAVRQAAAAARMPGALRFSSSGVSGRFASILTFSRPGDLFLVDATGVITDIHGDIESSVKLAQLKR